MAGVRIAAVISLALLAGFYGLRAAAAACVGAQCDLYIPLSVLVPALVLVMGAVTGVRATGHAHGALQPGWAVMLGTLTAVGVAGPVISLAVLRDQPDVLVPVASALSALVPLVALAYSLAPAPRRGAR